MPSTMLNLIVVTDLASTDHTIRVDWNGVSGWVGDVLVSPAVADVASDVEPVQLRGAMIGALV
jgi:hypothetical protein